MPSLQILCFRRQVRREVVVSCDGFLTSSSVVSLTRSTVNKQAAMQWCCLWTYSVSYRRDRCQQQLGEGFLNLHKAGLPHHLAPTARYWQHLWYSADSMNHVRWWRGGSDIINNSADQVLDFLSRAAHLAHMWHTTSGAPSVVAAAALTAFESPCRQMQELLKQAMYQVQHAVLLVASFLPCIEHVPAQRLVHTWSA